MLWVAKIMKQWDNSQNILNNEVGFSNTATAQQSDKTPTNKKLPYPTQLLTPDIVLALQRTHGNHYVQRLIESKREDTPKGIVQRVIVNAQKPSETAYVIDEGIDKQSRHSNEGVINLENPPPQPDHRYVVSSGETLYLHGHGDGVDTIGGYKPDEIFKKLDDYLIGIPQTIDLRACNPTRSKAFVERFAIAAYFHYGGNVPGFIGSSGTTFTDEEGDERTYNDDLYAQLVHYRTLARKLMQDERNLKALLQNPKPDTNLDEVKRALAEIDKPINDAHKSFREAEELAEQEALSRPREIFVLAPEEIKKLASNQLSQLLLLFQPVTIPQPVIQVTNYLHEPYDPEHPELDYTSGPGNQPYDPTSPPYNEDMPMYDD